jgi:hypothetical protein
VTHLLFEFISEVVASVDISDIQEYPVVAESALQLGREIPRRFFLTFDFGYSGPNEYGH